MLVSFIIPAYNAADTIERCLNSVYSLPLKPEEFEVIIIDDASTDNTAQIIENWRFQIENLTLLRQKENHRQGAARNRGVKVAKGEFICFVDSDDAVTEGIVHAIRLSKEKEADMAALHYGNANEREEITSEAERLSFAIEQIFTGFEMQNKHPYWCSAPWGYIYSKKFLGAVNYPFVEDVLFEDSDFVVVHLFHAKRMVYSSKLGYLAYYREGSTTRSTNYKNLADYLLLGTRMLSFYEKIVNDCVKCKVYGVEEQKFAEGILEGACWNVQKSCKWLVKLENTKAIQDYYNRVDSKADRTALNSDKRIQKYYWNAWTSICIGHKNIAIALLGILIPIYKLLKNK